MRNILKLIAIGLILLSCVTCKKVEDTVIQQQIDLIVAAMTSGTWNMTYFKENNTDNTNLANYQFKYYENFTVDATKNGITHRGTWGANQTTMTTQANFPASAGELTKINGNWNITRSTWTSVDANQTVASVAMLMKLEK